MVASNIVIASLSTAVFLWTISFVVHNQQSTSQSYPANLENVFSYQKAAVEPSKLKRLVFAIKNRSPQELEDLLSAVSDPRSPSFGEYLSLSELGALTYNQQGYEAVKNFLQDNDISNFHETKNRDFIVVDVPVMKAEQMLGTSFTKTIYSDASFVSSSEYTLPKYLAEHVDFIGGVFHRASWRKNRRLRKEVDIEAGPKLKGFVTPALLNEVYHVYNNEIEHGTGAALFEALGQSYSKEDLFKFEDTFGVPHQDLDMIIGPNTDNACQIDPGSCGEANLDVQYFIAMAQHSKTTYWSIGRNDPDPFLSWIVALADDPNPPLVHSISYGGDEREELTFGRFNQELIKLGLRGITVVVSSGDDGVNSPGLRQDPTQCGMSPSFPASSPYVVAVGATQGPESGREEIACSSLSGGIITSGGGFSTLFKQPAYQKESVEHYLKTAPASQLPSRSDFNANGRAYPDVSLLGFNYLIFDDLKCLQESGTSASAPVFAAMLTLINDELGKYGQSPLGFVNPLLYSLYNDKPEIFNDIVKGDNHCAAGYRESIHCCDFGFSAVAGWDPVTGLGSVNFARLKKAIVDIKTQKQMERFAGFQESEIYQ